MKAVRLARRLTGDPTRLPLLALGTLLLLFLVAPLSGLLLKIATGSGADLSQTYGNPETQAAVVTSLLTATTTTVIVGFFGVPLAYALARYRFPGKTLVSILVFLPLVLPPVSAGILLLVLYGPYGMIGQLLSPRGITLVDTSAGIVLAQIFVSAPFVVVSSRAAFERVEPDYEEAAATMGASAWQSFRHVALPLALPGIAAGLVLGWMRALGEFGATVILAYHPYSLPVLNYVDLSSTGLNQALPLALLALLIAGGTLLVLFALERFDWAPRLSGS